MEWRSSYRLGGSFLKPSSKKEKPFERSNLLTAYYMSNLFWTFDLANLLF